MYILPPTSEEEVGRLSSHLTHACSETDAFARYVQSTSVCFHLSRRIVLLQELSSCMEIDLWEVFDRQIRPCGTQVDVESLEIGSSMHYTA
nr:hypothetical protein Itr_chr09CG14730 [Ipomoea trifida]